MPDRIRFHLDENINPILAAGLRQRGVEVTTSGEMDLLTATDDDQLTFATSQQRVLVTHDRDFLRLTHHVEEHTGIAYCAPHKYAIGDLIRALLALWVRAAPDEMVNRVTFL